MKKIGIGLAGFGTVGSGVWNILRDNGGLITDRTGNEFQCSISKIAIRSLERATAAGAPAELCTTELLSLAEDPTVDMVVELIGGTTTAFDLVAASLKAGKAVVTGNKALLAERGHELFPLAKKHNTSIHFEAAVAGGIPIIQSVKDSLVGNKIESMVGIINGTSNYILERMTLAGLSYQEALEEAKDLGYAEADPTLDVNGWDAAHKAILLTSLAHGFLIDSDTVYVRGIERVKRIDINFASELGYVLKQLCVMRTNDDGTVELRAQPSFIPKSHILSNVNGVFNAIALKGDCVGFQPYCEESKLVEIGDTETPYYVRFNVEDRLGVVAKITNLLAEEGIGLSGMHSPINPDNPDEDFKDMVFLLHTCKFSKLRGALQKIEALDCVKERPTLFRIESFS